MVFSKAPASLSCPQHLFSKSSPFSTLSALETQRMGLKALFLGRQQQGPGDTAKSPKQAALWPWLPIPGCCWAQTLPSPMPAPKSLSPLRSGECT